MIQEKINIKYLPKKKLFTVFTQDVLTSVKQQYKFQIPLCLLLIYQKSSSDFYQLFPNKWINVNSPSHKTFCTGDRYPEHWSAVSVVTCANVRPMWTMWPSSAAWDHCQCAGHILRGRSDTDFTLITCNLMLKMYLGVKAAPINFIHSLVC